MLAAITGLIAVTRLVTVTGLITITGLITTTRISAITRLTVNRQLRELQTQCTLRGIHLILRGRIGCQRLLCLIK